MKILFAKINYLLMNKLPFSIQHSALLVTGKMFQQFDHQLKTSPQPLSKGEGLPGKEFHLSY